MILRFDKIKINIFFKWIDKNLILAAIKVWPLTVYKYLLSKMTTKEVYKGKIIDMNQDPESKSRPSIML